MKLKFRITKGKILIFVLFIGIFILVRYAMRDMNLDIDLLRESIMNMPGLVMENIQFSRNVSGDMWRVKIPYLEREEDTISIKSLDVRRELSGDKGEWSFFGREGNYYHEIKEASLNGLSGTLQNDERTWLLESDKLNWKEENNTFIFPEGLLIYDSEFLLRTPKASMDKSGVILLEQGGVIKWLKPIKTKHR